ncbi:MAG: DUF1329 domain-containing protein [Xanthomonadales bacterium]|nr:DUF1329 domain-containing protein [Xanthomonadales bacterium]
MSDDTRPIIRQLRMVILGIAIGVLAAGCASPGGEQESAATDSSAQEEQRAEQEAHEAQRKAEEAEMAAKAEAERKAEEAEMAAKAEAERKAREAEMAAKAEAERKAEEAEMAAKAEAERRAEEAEMAAQAEAEAEAARQAEAEQKAREEAERAAQAQAEAERRAQEEARAQAAAEAERRAREEAEQAEATPAPAARSEAMAAAAARDEERARQAAAGGEVRYDEDRATPAEIARLGNDLTPTGAVRAGNGDGTIPPWTGGITSPPAGYSVGDHHPDPFPGDRPLFSITGANYQQYSGKLSVGQIAMFERYPDTYRMDVYPTRRSSSFPQRIYDKTIENASTGRLTPNGEGVLDVAEGFPFPIPKNGPQLIWNHKMKFKGVSQLRYNNQVAPTANGAYTVIRLREETLGLYWREGNTIEDINNILLYFYQLVEGPARLAGNVLLVHETLNQVEQLRQAWIYNPGQRRVRRAPNVAYDNPGTASDGLRTNDMTDMFNGALDRYVWRLVGKQEMYVPYNSYKAHSDQVNLDDMVKPGHLNPDYMRYELHRIWIVDANLKSGVRHINPRRTFYLDEDSYQILLADHYDSRGNLWRFSEAHSINYYEVPTFWSTIETHHDLQSGRYIAVGLDNQEIVNDFNFKTEPADYTPQSLRQRGRR